MSRRFAKCVLSSLLLASIFIFQPPTSSANAAEPEYTTFDTPRFTLYFNSGKAANADDGVFTKNIAERAIDILNKTADEYTRVFGHPAPQKVVLRFLSPEEFRKQTGAPAWTSAMFYRGEISIPIVRSRGINFVELHRALRHEYVHAVIAELSDYRCPAWLDEGVAQLLEGQPNPLLGPALRSWIKSNEAMPLDWLQAGFTTLDSKIVPAAYAQSLFATRTLINNYGFGSVVKYLSALKDGRTEIEAFDDAFGFNRSIFQAALSSQIRTWAASDARHP